MTGQSRTMGAPPHRHRRRTYRHGPLAAKIALIYLGVVALSAVPHLYEVATGTTDGSYSILQPLLTTAPLSLVTVWPWFMRSESGPDSPLALLVAGTALVQALVLWRILRGPTVTGPGRGQEQSGPPIP
ncbi:SCO4225 family membrane protein [Ornithinimicrobium sp. W1679]|uniref:SCO4225 family membrane protein n=1 Tax=Ornithinimicrobium sp. W1679 TaxID=3418770 RepID=UPI003CEF9BD5